MDRQGICTAGNLIADVIYRIARYPGRGELTTILGEREMAVGGLACNTSLSLAQLDRNLPVYVSGLIGNDPEGQMVLSHFGKFKNIDTRFIGLRGQTSYTLVLNCQETRERTFFVGRGVGAEFDVEDVKLDQLPAKILHAGYILLLDALDGPDDAFGTRMARLLHDAQERGLLTSVDVVSEAGDRFRRLVPPALKYADYCVINEYEAQQITGVTLRSADGALLQGGMEPALERLKDMGVRRWAVIHCPEGAFGMDGDRRFESLPSLRLPEGYIKGTTGAGDAFCAGVLYAAHEDRSLSDALRLGIASAACSLGGPDSYSAVRPAPEALAFYREMGGA